MPTSPTSDSQNKTATRHHSTAELTSKAAGLLPSQSLNNRLGHTFMLPTWPSRSSTRLRSIALSSRWALSFSVRLALTVLSCP